MRCGNFFSKGVLELLKKTKFRFEIFSGLEIQANTFGKLNHGPGWCEKIGHVSKFYQLADPFVIIQISSYFYDLTANI